MRIDHALAEARARLTASPTARLDSELLLARVLGGRRTWLHAWPEVQLDPTQAARFEALIARRAAGEPVAYLLGEREFYSLVFEVTPDVLIPRPETELLVEAALEMLGSGAKRPRVLDLGTGSGCIAIALARARPDARVTAVESSAAALELARGNAARHGADGLEWLHGAWFEPVAGRRFDAIVANPPYVASADPHLDAGDVRFEPRAALDGGPDGLDALRAIALEAPKHLIPGGWIAVEHGAEQGDAVAGLFAQAGLSAIEGIRDAAGLSRVTMARATWST